MSDTDFDSRPLPVIGLVVVIIALLIVGMGKGCKQEFTNSHEVTERAKP